MDLAFGVSFCSINDGRVYRLQQSNQIKIETLTGTWEYFGDVALLSLAIFFYNFYGSSTNLTFDICLGDTSLLGVSDISVISISTSFFLELVLLKLILLPSSLSMLIYCF